MLTVRGKDHCTAGRQFEIGFNSENSVHTNNNTFGQIYYPVNLETSCCTVILLAMASVLCGQYYKASTSVSYESIVLNICNLVVITTLET